VSSHISRTLFAFQAQGAERFELGITPNRDVLTYDVEAAEPRRTSLLRFPCQPLFVLSACSQNIINDNLSHLLRLFK
jgi:hypothetical protein